MSFLLNEYTLRAHIAEQEAVQAAWTEQQAVLRLLAREPVRRPRLTALRSAAVALGEHLTRVPAGVRARARAFGR